MKNARDAALDGLIRMETRQGYSSILWNQILEKNKLDLREAALATTLFYGTLERKLTIDSVIASFYNKPIEKLTGPIRGILRLGIYQVLYMNKIPAHAAVNEAVGQAKRAGQSSAAGLVNAILRRVCREKERLPELSGCRSAEHEMSIRHSVSEWIVRLFISQYGTAFTEKLLSETLKPPLVHIRHNNSKTGEQLFLDLLRQEGIQADAFPLKGAFQISGENAIGNLRTFRGGYFHVQDLSSQICAHVVAPEAGDLVFDLCAAPGGKAFTLAQLMRNQGSVLAADIHKHKVELIREGAKRLSLPIIKPVLNDAASFCGTLGKADKILCDVPCSGLGIIRRKPEIKYKAEEELKNLPDIQMRILETSSLYLKKGGRLVYSTCTLNEKENQKVVEHFLMRHSDFVLEDLSKRWDCARSNKTITLFPHLDGTDGFFIASMIRK